MRYVVNYLAKAEQKTDYPVFYLSDLPDIRRKKAGCPRPGKRKWQAENRIIHPVTERKKKIQHAPAE